jgi:elongation factor P
MYDMGDIKKGLKIEIDNVPYVVEEFQHVKPGKGGAFNRTKLRNLLTGKVIDRTFKGGDKLEPASLEERKMQFLYKEGENYWFMDMESYEQVMLTQEQVGDNSLFMPENIETQVLYYKGEPISLSLPLFVDLQIVKADPWLKGDTASSATRPVTLSTGATIQVPLFVEEGDNIRVDTRTGEYVTRI